MKNEIILSVVLSLSVLLAAFPTATVVYAQSGPATANLQFRIFDSPTTESLALENCGIDINSWPLSSEFVASWSQNPNIVLQSYYAVDFFQFDINNWKWTNRISSCL